MIRALLVALICLSPATIHAQQTPPVAVAQTITNQQDWTRAIMRQMFRTISSATRHLKSGPWGSFPMQVCFVVQPDGRITLAKIRESSGSGVVDDAVLTRLQGMTFPPFSRDMGPSAKTFILPIVVVNEKPAEP